MRRYSHFGSHGENFLPEPSLSKEQKDFNRRRFFQGRINAYCRHYSELHKTDNQLKKMREKDRINPTGRPFYLVWWDLSALRAVASNPIVRSEAIGLRKPTLS